MTDLSFLAIGFALGLRHAADPDHLAAMATLAARQISRADALRHGLAWGFGHALTLFVLGSVLLVADAGLSSPAQAVIEVIIALMLMTLGMDLLRKGRMRRHAGDTTPPAFAGLRFRPVGTGSSLSLLQGSVRNARRATLIGVVHGLAGAMTVVTLANAADAPAPVRLGYLLLFGAGSIVGMAALSIMVAAGLRWLAPADLAGRTGWAVTAIGACNIALGLWLIAGVVTGH